MSIFIPIQRYRCCAGAEAPDCKWEGNIRIQRVNVKKPVHHFPGRSRPGNSTRSNGGINNFLRTFLPGKTGKASHRTVEFPIEDLGDLSFTDMAQITLDAIGDAVLVVNPNGKVIYLNRVAETMTGWSRKLAIGQSVEKIFFIIDGTTRQRRKSPSLRAINESRIVELALGSVLIRRDGTGIAIEDSAAPIHDSEGRLAGAVIVFHDARQSRFEMQKLSHLAQHDSLTGLPNRVLLMERLNQAIGMAKRHRKQAALLFLDLDHFKQINDTLGHAVGDRLLQEVASDIVSCVRATDTVSRHGGDEFIVLLTEIEKLQDSAQVAEQLLTRFQLPRTIDGQEFQVTLSIGISVYPENGLDAETLMRNADAAMYASKKNGRNSYAYCQT